MCNVGFTQLSDGFEIRDPVGAVCFDWGGTLMVDDGPAGVPMYQWPEAAAVEGAWECLAALYRHIPLCVATNAAQSDREMIEEALDRVDLLRFISRVFCFTEIGCTKDRPEFWRAVAQGLEVPPSEIVMIGDSIEHDVQVPHRQGIQAVWFNPMGFDSDCPNSVPMVETLSDFADMMTTLVTPPSLP